MTFRRFVEFATSIPDDSVDEGSEWRVGGEGVASVIAEILRSQGRQVNPPEFEGDHGWTFVARTQKGKYYFQVQHSGDVTVFTDDVTIPSLFGKRDSADHIALLTQLDAALQADQRFSNVHWCSEDEIFGAGAGTPSPTG